jgi:hypothetical protein
MRRKTTPLCASLKPFGPEHFVAGPPSASCPCSTAGLVLASAFIDADHKLISDQKARDSQYAVSCSSIAGVSRRS